MSHDTRQKIIAYLRENPGVNGGGIARAIGLLGSSQITPDLVFLRKAGVIRREGENIKALWHVVEGVEIPPPQQGGPRKGYHAHKHLCAYHQRQRRSGMGNCIRCREAGDAARRGNEVRLRRLFPGIFGAGAVCQ